MTDTDRERLAQAANHPLCLEALGREPADYTLPVLLIGLFYLLMPVLFFLLPVVLIFRNQVELTMMLVYAGVQSLWALPFLITASRTLKLRRLPAVKALGVVAATLPERRPGKWVRIERAAGEPLELRLRLRAYLDSTGGALAPGTVGVAMCKGDQMVEWVRIPEAT